MTDSIEVELETDVPVPTPERAVKHPPLDVVRSGSAGRQATLRRFSCGHGCGFIVNTN